MAGLSYVDTSVLGIIHNLLNIISKIIKEEASGNIFASIKWIKTELINVWYFGK